MTIVGVMGPGESATEEEKCQAFELGRLIAQEGWVLLTGGRQVGVMDAASQGAKAERGMVVGILPGVDVEGMSAAVDIPIITGMREARNNVNVLSSRVLFFIGMNSGTASELALALKHQRPVILVRPQDDVVRVFARMNSKGLEAVGDVQSALERARQILGVV
jgi:hypothetical protein